MSEIIIDNAAAAAESKQYMRKFVVKYPAWCTKDYIVVRGQNAIDLDMMSHGTDEKKYLVTIIVEEV